MFITERLVSLFFYALALFIACALIKRVVNKQYRAVILGYLAILCLFAFFYKPYITADLWRLREYVQWWIDKPASEIIQYSLRSSTPTWVIYSWVLTRLNDVNWLQTFTCLWAFSSVFYVIIHEIERTEAIANNRNLMLFYVMAIGAFYLQTISGIRTMLGISIVVFCFYRETVECKSLWKHIILYLFAALLHSAIMILVISRFIFLVFQYKEPVKKLAMMLFILLLGALTLYYLGDYISSSFEYGQRYLTDSNEYTYFWEILIGLIESIETIYVVREYRRRFKGTINVITLNAVWLFCLIWCIISLASLPFSYAIFRRYAIFCSLISVPLLSQILEEERNNKHEMYNFSKNIRILSMVVFVISCTRGDLCGYKFFVL